MASEPVSLLDVLAAQIHCAYLSDLRDSAHHPLLKEAVAEIPASAYSVFAWNDAVHYITMEKHDYTNAAEARERLLAL